MHRATAETFVRGDRVRHESRPEWGIGTVDQAAQSVANGQPGQRLVVHFPHKGRVTLHTSTAPLVRVDDVAEAAAVAEQRGWLAELERGSDKGLSAELPDRIADPLASATQRLSALIDTFRFTDDPRGMIDWAVAQSGLDDPFTAYGRDEIAEAFRAFRAKRRLALTRMIRERVEANDRATLEHALHQAKRGEARDVIVGSLHKLRSRR